MCTNIYICIVVVILLCSQGESRPQDDGNTEPNGAVEAPQFLLDGSPLPQFSVLQMSEDLQNKMMAIKLFVAHNPNHTGKLHTTLSSLTTAIQELDKVKAIDDFNAESAAIPKIVEAFEKYLKSFQAAINEQNNFETISRKDGYDSKVREKLLAVGDVILLTQTAKLKHIQRAINAHSHMFHNFAAAKQHVDKAIKILKSFKLDLDLAVTIGTLVGGITPYYIREKRYRLGYEKFDLIFPELTGLIAQFKTQQQA